MSAHVCDGRRGDCLGCAAMARRMADVRAAMTIDDRLDDVTRARIWAKLDERIAAAAPSTRRARWRWPAAFALAAAAAAALGIATRRPADEPAAVAPAVAERALVAPADVTVTATIGSHTRAALIGPARMEVLGAAGDATTVRLVSGTMYASFEGGAGRSLRVVAPGAVVDVVGTLFAVDAGGGAAGTCVSVAHGRVKVTMGVRVRMVGGGEKVCTGVDEPRPEAIDPRVREALEQHEAATVTASVPVAVAVAVPVAAAVPAPKRVVPVRLAPQNVPEGQGHGSGQAQAQPQPQPEANAGDLYRAAEAALAGGDPAAADRALARLIAEAPASKLVDQALYERARIAYQRHAWGEARRDLDALAAIASTPLAEPGRYLGCRIAVEARDGDAARCLAEYRAAYPRSPHDLDVLALLAQLAFQDRGCDGARSLVDELAQMYPHAALTGAWRARCPEAP